jgi:hypothetical protein
VNPEQLPHSGTDLSQIVTGIANTVPERDDKTHLSIAGRVLRFILTSFWPRAVIAAGGVACVIWSAALLWLAIHAFG